MRRTAFALFLVMLAVVHASPVPAQTQDPVITSARQLSQQGQFDEAIAALRAALVMKPNDEALKFALIDALSLKRTSLTRMINDLNREINELRPARVIPGCGAAATGTTPTMAPVRVGGGILQPTRLKWVPPVYPQEAQDAKVQGIVIVEAVIDCAGDVAEARVLRGVPLLNDAAVQAVKQWKYTPTLLNGAPVPVIMTVTVTFTVH